MTDKIHPVVEAEARAICRARFLRVGGEHAREAQAINAVQFDQLVVDPEWQEFVPEAIAALQAFEPLLVDAFEYGAVFGRSKQTDIGAHAESYTKRLLKEISGG